jgi:adenylate cyclase class IV
MTYKIRQENSLAKSNKEYEVEFKDYENMCFILENVGFKKYGYSVKKRISYILDNIVFDIDDFP